MSDDILNKIKNVEVKLKDLKEQEMIISNRIKKLQAEKQDLQALYTLSKIKSAADTSKWLEEKFEWSSTIKSLLKNIFKFNEFRSKQLAAINATLSKKDVILLMPTGGGKSLVYQLPALVNKHLTLVVSPLISLIEDQLIALENLHIKAATLNSNSLKMEKKIVHQRMIDGKSTLNLLYVTPEWVAKSKMFMTYLQKCFDKGYLDRIVIDEVHCCSTWGHDFRPEYNYLGFFKSMFPAVPILGLTATATMGVLIDIQKMLNIEDSLIITAPFNRPNLRYKVVTKSSHKEECVEYIVNLLKTKYANQSGIIYSLTIKDCEELAESLSAKGLRVKQYHGQMDSNTKKTIHERWLHNKYQAVVATIAFGMGIDKPDVRFVIHHAVPKSMEGYYQESGRAGRDGKNADCILMYSLVDFLKNVSMASSKTEEKNAAAILGYCIEQKKCRRQCIAEHFEDNWEPSHCQKMCDNCEKPPKISYYDITPACRDLHAIIDALSLKEVKLTLLKLVSGWFQTGPKELRVETLNKPRVSKEDAEDIIAFLILKGHLRIDKGYTMYSTIAYIQKGEPKDKIYMPYHLKLRGFAEIAEENEPPLKKTKNT